ncbi:GNAT family N-acetyltransferase [Pinibacter aurantiacus]|uniref:GNAT family N-acetyltransferase n=1 Tax=Pinibacter aurantiacus TaxID=2851599 RepID=A0A9E2W3T5_9BACT|nr:GNAT family N-acetyltransferase [Pinibacter aurantiacus]MBV4357154.1 GNAT family N-acetyltransferase [Pinibacter aurantiacus]
MALKLIDYGSREYQQMVHLRNEVLRKPLGLYFTKEELESEKDHILIGAFEDDELLACCILIQVDKETVRLRQMAVLRNLQGKGVGRAIMNFAEKVALDRGYTRMVMHARKSAVGFYEKLGYEVTSNEFVEVTIPHFEMEKPLISVPE